MEDASRANVGKENSKLVAGTGKIEGALDIAKGGFSSVGFTPVHIALDFGAGAVEDDIWLVGLEVGFDGGEICEINSVGDDLPVLGFEKVCELGAKKTGGTNDEDFLWHGFGI